MINWKNIVKTRNARNVFRVCTMALVGTIALSGCQSNKDLENEIDEDIESVESVDIVEEERKEVSISEVLEASKSIVNDMSSYASDFTSTINMDDGYTNLITNAKVMLDETGKLLGHINVDTNDNGETTMQNLYLEEIHDEVSIFSEKPTEWTEIRYNKEEALKVIGVYNGIKNFGYFLENAEDWVEVQPEEPVGNDIVTVKGTIPQEKLYDMISNTLLFYFMGMNQIDEFCYDDSPDVDVVLQFTIDGQPVGFSIELADVLESTSNYILKELGSDADMIMVENYNIKQTFYDINEPQGIEIPLGARDAINYKSNVYMMN